MLVRIEGTDLPALACPGEHVGVQRGTEVVDLVAVEAAEARWTFEANARVTPDGGVQLGGPYLHGRSAERFVYLSWGTLDEASGFAQVRRTKIYLSEVDPVLLRMAAQGTHTLVGRLALANAAGAPVTARVRAADIAWSVAPLTG